MGAQAAGLKKTYLLRKSARTSEGEPEGDAVMVGSEKLAVHHGFPESGTASAIGTANSQGARPIANLSLEPAAARLDSTRLDIRIKSQKHDRNGGGAPSEDPRELRRSPTLKRECAKRGIVQMKKNFDEKK